MRSTKLPSWIERLAGLEPLPVPPSVFGLSRRQLVYGRFERAGAAVRCLELSSRELPPDTFQRGLLGGALREPRAFEELVASFVGALAASPREASLVLPDGWLRLSFTASGALPSKPGPREEVVRWKLKRLVPFRVEELRVQALEVEPLPQQEEPKRLLLAFGLESLFSQLEAAFAAAGVRVGQISNESLSLLAAMDRRGAPGTLDAVVRVADEGYGLLFAAGDEPVLHRFKPAVDELPDGARASLVSRDLKLTRSFLTEHLPGSVLGRVVLAAPPGVEAEWLGWLAHGLGVEPEPLAAGDLPPLAEAPPALPWAAAAPLLGAARREVP